MLKNPDIVLKALADPTRRQLLEHLIQHGEHTVRELTDHSDVSQPMVSKHLAVLKGAGLVSDHPEGRVVNYRAEPKALAPLYDWLDRYRGFWLDRFNRLESTLKRMDQ